jgi:dienelactone hydrolase
MSKRSLIRFFPLFLSLLLLKTGIASAQLPWDTIELYKTPKTYPADSCKRAGFESFFYEGLEYKACRTRVFAYYKTPAGVPPDGGWPAVICIHGGGGTAFPEWVQAWVDHGYAAIAMDLEGHLPKGDFPNREWHEKAGPPRITTFGDIELADREQWFYHAVADVVKAHSLLRSFPEINSKKIGIHGISWGGVIASAVMGIDHRLAFAIPVYGCGFLYQTTSPGFKKYFDVMTDQQLKAYKAKWDPSLYLPGCTIPALFYIGTNDGAFPLDIWQRSARLTRGRKILCIPVSSEHGHIWNQPEIFAFADAVIGNGNPLIQISEAEIAGGQAVAKVTVTYDPTLHSPSKIPGIVYSVLVYTTDTCDWQHRQWHSVPAKQKEGKVFSELRPGTKAFYFNITDERGLTFSSGYTEKE